MVKVPPNDERVLALLRDAKKIAREYYDLTNKPLGVTGEVAEYEAARLLGVTLTPARQAGYDAVEETNGMTRRLQIKGRCLQENCKPGQRIGSIRQTHDWDAVLLVLLNESFEATAIYEAQRADVIAALNAPGSKARTERGALSVSKFKSIGTLRWPAVAPGPTRRLSALFRKKPTQWGLRGDPYLWKDMTKTLNSVPWPETERDFVDLLERTFAQLTGDVLSTNRDSIYVAQYAHGGMSNGQVSPEFWREKAFPLLRRRYASALSPNGDQAAS